MDNKARAGQIASRLGEVDQGFRNCLQTVDNQRQNIDCRVPLGGAQLSQFVERQNTRVRSEAAVPDSGFYFIE